MADDTPIMPLARLVWRDRAELSANAWNPNRVAPTEMDLLVRSVAENGWTQPIVTQPDGEIVDGFHRWTISDRDEIAALTAGMRPGENVSRRETELRDMLDRLVAGIALEAETGDEADANDCYREARDLLERYDADDLAPRSSILVPTVSLDSDTDPATLRMATIRHNRARGAHGVLKMADIVADLSQLGVSPEEIGERLGMEKVEVTRLLDRGKMTTRAVSDDGELGKAWHTEFAPDPE